MQFLSIAKILQFFKSPSLAGREVLRVFASQDSMKNQKAPIENIWDCQLHGFFMKKVETIIVGTFIMPLILLSESSI